ncbi:hypothetical protein C2I18_20035 [Paenibacillus sp. PK3_47]|uniref:hypothetical protein n=1 Tax=Paenibacillus sp. PK3_47 TaxID=2072642 RepID=UPI00201DACF0|nr:hypothetical protein [Paenibacillus sp. PK3_47]UQZ35609.1 hypothetical protein C2I18_20035 [Paenibacillus sp. PK3_47]
MFKDAQHAWNPTPDEIKAWAYSDEGIPDQDWELAVNSFDNIPVICGFIDDERCKKTSFFLGSLYVFTGDIVRSGIKEDVDQLSELLDNAEYKAQSEMLHAWIKRSKHLIHHPDTYDYAYWGLYSRYVYK